MSLRVELWMHEIMAPKRMSILLLLAVILQCLIERFNGDIIIDEDEQGRFSIRFNESDWADLFPNVSYYDENSTIDYDDIYDGDIDYGQFVTPGQKGGKNSAQVLFQWHLCCCFALLQLLHFFPHIIRM